MLNRPRTEAAATVASYTLTIGIAAAVRLWHRVEVSERPYVSSVPVFTTYTFIASVYRSRFVSAGLVSLANDIRLTHAVVTVGTSVIDVCGSLHLQNLFEIRLTSIRACRNVVSSAPRASRNNRNTSSLRHVSRHQEHGRAAS